MAETFFEKQDGLPWSNFWESVLSVLRDGLAVVDGHGAVLYVNRRARELMGIPDGEEPPLLLRRYAPEIYFHSRDSLDSPGQQLFEVSVTYPERRLLRVSRFPLARREGLALSALVLADRTAEEELGELRREEDACVTAGLLAGALAHELGNPLNGIQIHLQLLLRQLRSTAGSAALQRTVEVCRDEVDRLCRMIGNFLGSIRPTKPVLRRIDLNGPLRDCLPPLAMELERRNGTVGEEFSAEPLLVLGDPEQLRQVFENLLRNGLDALEGSGRIVVRSADEGAFARVEVEDDGVGIDPSALPNLFRPQWTTKQDGNGFGLLVVRSILRAHRATIAFQSLNPHGTRVTLRFPLENPKFPMLAGTADQQIT
ncbi:MAG: PAS domain-containing protein [Puniceicoccales bacterium]|jgi:signal transduction histidine kinase|nr:PAS domain-containing protein [Puniceicoccales bacterium]